MPICSKRKTNLQFTNQPISCYNLIVKDKFESVKQGSVI